MGVAKGKITGLSFPRKCESMPYYKFWIPVFTGMTHKTRLMRLNILSLMGQSHYQKWFVMPNNLPPNWSWVKLGDVAKLVRGVSYKKELATKSPRVNYLPIVRATNINSSLNFNDLVYVPKKLIKDEQIIKEGDVIIAISSGSKDLVGKTAQAYADTEVGFGTFCGLIRFSSTMNKRFFGHFFQSREYRNHISKVSIGVNINNLRREHIEELTIPLPPLSEQIKIVEKIEELFSGLDNGVASLKKAKEQIRLYRQSVLSAAFSGRLTQEARGEKQAYLNVVQGVVKAAEPKIEYENKLPDGWKWVKLGEIISPSKARFEPLQNDIVKYIGLEHIEKGTGIILSYADSNTVRSTKSVFKKGNLLYGKLRPYLNKIAIAEFDGVCSTDILVFENQEKLSNKFLKYRLLCKDYVNYAQKNMKGVQHPRINFNSISEFEISLPEYTVQTQIGEEIERWFSETDNLEKAIDDSLAKSELLRQSLLSQAFSGKLIR